MSTQALRTINRLLVANRGEIACRIMRSAHRLGLECVAVHSPVDRDARHCREADLRVELGGDAARDSYLRIDALIDAARASDAQAIHPGYGFLSENAGFAHAVEAAGLILLGPPAAAIEAMGSKSAAKTLMQAAGVPLVPGYHGQQQDLETLRAAAESIGYPVLLKASAGGGGKGMKIVECESELAGALDSGRREALAAFGDAHMLLEKYLLQPRHVEIQVFADQHGHCLYLNERDCSIQRRHQKVVEEAPAPGLTPELRRAMGEAAVRAAQAIGYVGAGTVEFLLDARGEFFFMEMNTRLQVEHPVTEAITGLDLVEWQIRVARGEALPIRQIEVPLDGHAIEVRLYAEDPEHDFLPATGCLEVYREPAAGPGRRVDSGVSEGDCISPFYDPMLGKVIAWGETREMARQRLLAMLDEFAVGGVRTNLAFLRRIVAHPAFAAAQLDTGFIARHQQQLLAAPAPLDDDFWQAAALAFSHDPSPDTQPASPWQRRDGLRLGLPGRVLVALRCAQHRQVVALDTHSATVRQMNGHLLITRAGVSQVCPAIRRGTRLYLSWQGRWHLVERFDALDEADTPRAAPGSLAAPMNGSIVRVLVEVGQQVQAGTPLLVMEAMKMEHSLRAPHAGLVTAVHGHEGERVDEGKVLVELQAQEG